MRQYVMFCFFLVILSVCSCRSTSKVTENVVDETLNVTNSEKVDDVTSVTSNSVREDSSETVSLTFIIEYDTDKVDEQGKSPVKRTTAALTTKKKGSRNDTKTQKEQNISATKEESAEQVKQENNRREDTRAETKQPLYISFILFGVACVILMAVLAYWVFTKYRAAKPQGE